MSNDYDDYSYENYEDDSKGVAKKRLIIVILVVVAIIAIILLLKGCTGRSTNKPNDDFSYENTLLQAGKLYYENNSHTLPTAKGECSTVTLETLLSLGLINANEFNNCNKETTYVKVCMMDDNNLQWTPWLTCTNYSSDTLYDAEKEGTVSEVVKDQTLITNFAYLPQKYVASEDNLGEVEELWKDEITYATYKTLASNTYYRYRDLEYIWNIKVRTYYSSTGNKDNASSVKEYYTSSPAKGFTKKDDSAIAYKWYTVTGGEKIYALNEKGEKKLSATPIEGYPNNDEGKTVNFYRTRTVQTTYAPTLYYSCAKSSTSTDYINQTVKCGEGPNSTHTYQVKTFYACNKEQPLKAVSKDTVCKLYSDWSQYSTKSCGNKSDVCEVSPKTYYYWYKVDKKEVRSYYPSKSSTASGEKVYYTSAPVKGAQKDESTKTTAYKWYKESDGQTTKYYAVSPQSGATKTDKSRWSDWSKWSLDKPGSLGNAGTRKTESRVKIKLQEIKGEATEEEWKNLSEEYVTLEEMINIFKTEKYEVETLNDINNNGEIRYQVKMFIRNKKIGEK
ncbi:MAG: hypothetical protein IJB83_00295 [Bacilli bacterium]|nr:hypothetical protein [Bacilli bacterium]